MPTPNLNVMRAARAMYLAAPLALMVGAPAHADPVHGQGTWETTLQGRDLDGTPSTIEAYYDTDRHITWLANANLPYTSGYTSAANGGLDIYEADMRRDLKVTNGMMGWDAAQTWVSNLNVNGTTGWYLPKAVDPSAEQCPVFGYGDQLFCGGNPDKSTSELAHMYFVTLGNTDRFNVPWAPGSGMTNTGPFSNLMPAPYSFGLEVDNTNGDYAWSFFADSGGHQMRRKDLPSFAWAIHDGDVGSPVPEPQTGALVLVGLIMAGVGVRRRTGRR
ncbi:MAG: PEP-CTERM sorting domain-containing protein [Rubrivivax sp.]|nr:MAG: PEP-CTERM sorting domain-containing protein [Rubrivivax sp.]